MNTLTDFRRHYLRFDRPLYPSYVRSTIPRFYSSFFPSARTVYLNRECDTSPEIHPIRFSVMPDEENTIVHANKCFNPLNILEGASVGGDKSGSDYSFIIIIFLVIIMFYTFKK